MHDIYNQIKTHIRTWHLVLVAFLAGCILTGFFIFGQRSALVGKLDKRYALEYSGATEIIGRLEDQLEQEREYNRQLREHNTRAREIATGLTVTAERNVGNLQDAVGLVRDIREKVKVLEDFYANSDSGDSSD